MSLRFTRDTSIFSTADRDVRFPSECEKDGRKSATRSGYKGARKRERDRQARPSLLNSSLRDLHRVFSRIIWHAIPRASAEDNERARNNRRRSNVVAYQSARNRDNILLCGQAAKSFRLLRKIGIRIKDLRVRVRYKCHKYFIFDLTFGLKFLFLFFLNLRG